MDGEYALSDGGWRVQFGTAGNQRQDFDIFRLRAEKVGDRVQGKVGDRGEAERTQTGLRGYGREVVGRDWVARDIEVGDLPSVEHRRLSDYLQQVLFCQWKAAGHIAEERELL